MWKRKVAEQRPWLEDEGDVEVEVEVEVEEEDEVLNPQQHGWQFQAPHVERPRALPPRQVDPPTGKGVASGSFLARKSAELAQRDLACKAICRVKRGLRGGNGSNGRPFIPEDWDTAFKPSLGSYIRFLLSRPDQFKVTEGSGPGLFTIEDITGNEVVTREEVTALKGNKGKSTKGSKDSKGHDQKGNKGSGNKGSGTKGSVSAKGKVGKVSAKGGVLKGQRKSQAGKGITPPTSRTTSSSQGKFVKPTPKPPSTAPPPHLMSRPPIRPSDNEVATAQEETEEAPAVSEAEDEEPEPADDALGWNNDFDQEAEEAAAEQAANQAFQDDAVEDVEPPSTWKRSSLIAALLT